MLVGRIHSEETHPISRVLIRLYEPVVRWSLRWKWAVIGGALALILATVPVFTRLGSEFMPPLDEGALFYMPTTMPGISITEAQKLLQVERPDHHAVPGGRSRPRQGGTRRHEHRPGAALDAGDSHHAEAARRSGAA